MPPEEKIRETIKLYLAFMIRSWNDFMGGLNIKWLTFKIQRLVLSNENHYLDREGLGMKWKLFLKFQKFITLSKQLTLQFEEFSLFYW